MSGRATRFALVLGAGSSFDFGLPLGARLRKIIAEDLDIRFDDFGRALISGSHEIVDALRELVRDSNGRSGDINPHRAAAVQISEAMPYSSSIDEYIERHRDNKLKAECAKLAIGKAILEEERKSTIFGDPTNPEVDPLRLASDTWIARLLRDVTRGLAKSEVESSLQEFSVINFNYDRCFEHFVYHWLRRIYEFSDGEAGEIVSQMSIFHPYGKLGDLHFQSPNNFVPFGGEVKAHRLLAINERIRTYSETIETDSGLDAALERMGQTRKVVYLGFGFHKQNMDLIQLPAHFDRPTARCYATTVEVPEPKWEIFESRICQSLRVPSGNLFVGRNSKNCSSLWDEFGENVIA